MGTGSIKNTYVGNSPLARMTIGVTREGGECTVIELVRDPETNDLVVKADPPSEREINELYLTVHGWMPAWIDGMDAWTDPATGAAHTFESALCIQESREQGGSTSAGMFANGETALADAFGGE